MVKVGEEGGVLDDILDRLASLLEHEAGTKARIKAATRYPVIVLVSIAIAFVILTTFVVPKFAALYASSKVALPLPTRILIFINMAIRTYWPFIAVAIAGLIFAVKGYIKTPSGRWNLDKLKLRTPDNRPCCREDGHVEVRKNLFNALPQRYPHASYA